MDISQRNDIINLLPALKRKEHQAQKELFLKHFPYSMEIALRYAKNRMDAEEIVNDVFVKVFTKIGNYQPTFAFKAWLSKITVNTAIDKFRVNAKQVDLIDLSDEMEVSDASFDALFEREDIPILPLIRGLPERYRLVFNMYVFDDYSHKEIAQKLGIAIGTSKSCLARAKKFIQSHELLDQQLKALHVKRI